MMPVLLIHGGAGGERPPEVRSRIAEDLRTIGSTVWPRLEQDGSAVDAVVHATELLEKNPLFNAGFGSKLQCDGGARLSAALMDGATERFAGVVNVEQIAHPIALARHLLDEEDRVLAGEGALVRAKELGFQLADVRTEAAVARWHKGVAGQTGTVGAVALDSSGRLAAATSTGGRGMERVGRVSDSCTVAGNFATSAAAVSCTGIGEHIVDGALAVRIVAALEAGAPMSEAAAAIALRMRDRGWQAGLIALDGTGAWAAPHTTERLYWHAIDSSAHHSFHSSGA
jgi:L-asparaginase